MDRARFQMFTWLMCYVWTHRGVRVNTDEGFVFLGHAQTEKIVHDLDAMMNADR